GTPTTMDLAVSPTIATIEAALGGRLGAAMVAGVLIGAPALGASIASVVIEPAGIVIPGLPPGVASSIIGIGIVGVGPGLFEADANTFAYATTNPNANPENTAY